MERWKAIKGYENAYEVSSHGRVRSLDRKRPVHNRYGSVSNRTDKGKEIIPHDNGHGYLYVTLQKNGKKHNFYVHRLVADAFCENRDSKNCINHKDLNKKNNHADNLEWCTQRENVLYSVDLMRKPKKVCKPSSTGEKYIHYDTRRKNPRYRLAIKQLKIDKRFKTLEEAIEYKKKVMEDGV